MIAPQNSAPSIAVPTHFAKVIMASKDKTLGGGVMSLVKSSGFEDKEWSVGAFVLPNAVIDDRTPLTSFVVPSKFFFFFPQDIPFDKKLILFLLQS